MCNASEHVPKNEGENRETKACNGYGRFVEVTDWMNTLPPWPCCPGLMTLFQNSSVFFMYGSRPL